MIRHEAVSTRCERHSMNNKCTRIVAIAQVAVAMSLLASATAAGCIMSAGSYLEIDPQPTIESSTVILAGRGMRMESEDSDAVVSRLEVDTVFKGEAPRVLVVRARPIDNPCSDVYPAGDFPFFVFLRAASGNIQAPEQILFIAQSALPADFSKRLGAARKPVDDSSALLPRLAPARVPAGSIKRSEGEVATESWTVRFDPDTWHWDGKPRFYLRYPRATFMLEPDYVLGKIAARRLPAAFVESVRSSMPLRESTDLYKFTLVESGPIWLQDELERLAIDAAIDGNVRVLPPNGCCVRTVQIVRSALGTQVVQAAGRDLVRSRWEPESAAQVK